MNIYHKSLLCLFSTFMNFSPLMAMEKQEEKLTLSALPDEINLEILKYVPVKDLVNVSQVSQNLNRLVSDDGLWSDFSTHASLTKAEKPKNLSWREFYKEELKPNLIRFSAQQPLPANQNIASFHFEVMGALSFEHKQSRNAYFNAPELMRLTKNQLRQNDQCLYSAISPFSIFGPAIYWNSLKGVKATPPPNGQLLDKFHDIEALTLRLSKDYESGELSIKFREQSPAKS